MPSLIAGNVFTVLYLTTIGAERLRCVLPFIAQYLMDAWGLRLRCKYGSDRITALGVVVGASEMGRGADGRSAMADG